MPEKRINWRTTCNIKYGEANCKRWIKYIGPTGEVEKVCGPTGPGVKGTREMPVSARPNACLPETLNAAQQLRLVFAELGAPSIPSSFAISRVNEVFDENGKLLDERYNNRVVRLMNLSGTLKH
jgi:hypothetical protein